MIGFRRFRRDLAPDRFQIVLCEFGDGIVVRALVPPHRKGEVEKEIGML